MAYAPPTAFIARLPDSRYHAEVAFADDQIGSVVSDLERLELAQRTLLVLTSDHGEGLGEHGEFEKAAEATRRAIALRQSRETVDEPVDLLWDEPATFEAVQPIREP